jgi:predicted small secreted protein
VRKEVKKAILILLATSFLVAIAGCNTVAGFGEDITASSRAVQRAL